MHSGWVELDSISDEKWRAALCDHRTKYPGCSYAYTLGRIIVKPVNGIKQVNIDSVQSEILVSPGVFPPL